MTEEIWKEIPGMRGLYKASKNGDVYSVRRNKILKQSRVNGHYVSVTMSIDGVKTYLSLHKIIAITFIGPRPDGFDINHKDGNRHNNNVENLEYVTRADNVRFTFIGKKRGICKKRRFFMARIYFDKKFHYIGTYKNKEDAYKAFFEAYLLRYNQKPW